jgi:hypothetical protein
MGRRALCGCVCCFVRFLYQRIVWLWSAQLSAVLPPCCMLCVPVRCEVLTLLIRYGYSTTSRYSRLWSHTCNFCSPCRCCALSKFLSRTCAAAQPATVVREREPPPQRAGDIVLPPRPAGKDNRFVCWLTSSWMWRGPSAVHNRMWIWCCAASTELRVAAGNSDSFAKPLVYPSVIVCFAIKCSV